MKTVSSIAQATQLAARSGASLEVNGRRINSAGTKLSVVAPKQAPAAVAEPAQADPLDRIALLIARQGEAMRSAVEALARQAQHAPAAQMPPAHQPGRLMPAALQVLRNGEGVPNTLVPMSWTVSAVRPKSFDLVKDSDGNTTQIIPIYR